MMKAKLKQPSLQTTSIQSVMKSTSSSIKTGKKSNKVYVPISEASENIANVRGNKQQKQVEQPELMDLKRVNNELRAKEQIYIEKLIKLEEGLEKQHIEFMNLQDIYNELFSSYKLKEQEIAELQMKFRESDRKKTQNPPACPPNIVVQKIDNSEQINKLKALIQEKNSLIHDLETQIQSHNSKFQKIEKQHQKLYAEINYLKSKEKMNDSKASLNSKMFEELEEWQKIADEEKQGKIRLQYENEFYKSRNLDLEARIKQFQQIIALKQAEVGQLRQNNIMLHRQSSEARLSRSKSPRRTQNSPRKQSYALTKMNSVIDQLHAENRQLRLENNRLKAQMHSNRDQLKYTERRNFESKNSSLSGGAQIREQEFFSFSRDQLPGLSTLQNLRNSNKAESNDIRSSRIDTYESRTKTVASGNIGTPQNESYQSSPELQELPTNLQVEQLMKQRRRRNNELTSPKMSREKQECAFQFA